MTSTSTSRPTDTARRRGGLPVVAAFVAALTALTALTGCSAQRPDAAAVVGGHVIRTADLQRLTQEYLEIVPTDDPGRAQNSLLNWLVYGRMLRDLGAQHDIRVPQGRIASQADQIVEQAGGRAKVTVQLAQQGQGRVPPSLLKDWLEFNYLFQALSAEFSPSGDAQEVQDVFWRNARRIDVEVNPRFGRWVVGKGIVPQVGGGLSKTERQLLPPTAR